MQVSDLCKPIGISLCFGTGLSPIGLLGDLLSEVIGALRVLGVGLTVVNGAEFTIAVLVVDNTNADESHGVNIAQRVPVRTVSIVPFAYVTLNENVINPLANITP